MFKGYEGGEVVFKLFGDIMPSLERARRYVSDKTAGAVTLEVKQKSLDISALLALSGDNGNAVLLDETVKSFIKTFSDYIYAQGNVSLEQNAVDLLRVSGKRLCTAESFTGGGVARAIVSVPGASEVFYEGLVCYDTESKQKRLGVRADTVRKKSVVSREVAFEMVKGLLANGECDVAVATTGYASPTGDPNKPCGLCYVAAATDNKAEVFKYNFNGDRKSVMEQGTAAALYALNKILNGK